MNRIAAALALLVSLAAAPALAAGPGGRGNYFNLRVEALSFHQSFTDAATGQVYLPGTVTVPGGLSIDWGGFSSEYVAAGTRISFTRADSGYGNTLSLGGGPQFHIPIGEQVLLLPSINIGYRLSSLGMGFGFDVALALAYRFDRFYAGLEANQPLFLYGSASADAKSAGFFPAVRSAHVLFGFYY